MRRALIAGLVLAGCSQPLYTSGSLRCAPSGRLCPDGFYCAVDQHCWRNGSAPPAPDLAMSVPGDLAPATVSDLAPPPGSDLATPPSTCGSASVRFCDGFEAGAIGAAWMVDTVGGSTITVDGTRAWRGRYSLHAHTAATASGEIYANLRTGSGLPVAGGTVYARVWVWLAAPIPAAFDQMVNFVDNGGGGIALGMQDAQVVANDYVTTNWRQSTTTIPAQTWTCVALSIDQGGATGDVHLYVNDGELADARLTGVSVTSMIGIYLGLDFLGGASGSGAEDAWFDELIIDDKPVSCAE